MRHCATHSKPNPTPNHSKPSPTPNHSKPSPTPNNSTHHVPNNSTHHVPNHSAHEVNNRHHDRRDVRVQGLHRAARDQQPVHEAVSVGLEPSHPASPPSFANAELAAASLTPSFS